MPFFGRKMTSRAVRLFAVAALVPLVATACSEASAGPESDGPAPVISESGSVFPVTIDHALGSTTVPSQPERVVTIGWASHDTVLALGVTPVGIAEDGWAGGENGLLPWTDDAITRTGQTIGEVGSGADVSVFSDSPELNIEQIAALDPDLILATYSGITQEQFDQLNKLAPTVAYPETPWLVSWQDQTLINGKALGLEDEAAELIRTTEESIFAAGAEHAPLLGTNFAFIYAQDDGTVGVYLPGDPRVDLLIGLGMTPADSVANMSTADGKFYAEISLEHINKLKDVEVLITWFNSEEEQQALEEFELFQKLPAVRHGSYIPMLDRQLSMAVSTTTVLSVPWSLDAFVPELADAADASRQGQISDRADQERIGSDALKH